MAFMKNPSSADKALLRARRLASSIFALAALASGLSAQTSSWLGVTSSSWSDSTNWQGGIPDSSRATLVSNGSPSRFDLLIPHPEHGDTARVGDLKIQQHGRIIFSPMPQPGILIVHGAVLSLNGGEVKLGEGRIIFRHDVQLNNGGVLDAGAGTLEFQGDVTSNAGAAFTPGTSTVVFAGDSDQTIAGDMAFANLVVRTAGTLSFTGAITVTGNVSVASGSTLLIDSGATFLYDGIIDGGGEFVDVNTPPTTHVGTELSVPSAADLLQNFPNPFNPETMVIYRMLKSGDVRLSIYDMTGKEIAVLVDGTVPAGEHAVRWNASHLPSGVYHGRLTTNDRMITRAFLLIR